jgi:uncharacterized protein (TIGR03067 family)
MNARWLIPLLPGLLLTIQDGHKTATAKDLAAFQGTWKIQWAEEDGRKFEFPNSTVLTVQGKKMFLGKQVQCSFEINPHFSPKLLDVTFLAEDDQAKGQTAEGIYMIVGDEMIWCWYNGGGVKKRPLAFSTEKGSGRMIFAFVRVKP